VNRFDTTFPFASHHFLCDGHRILVALKDKNMPLLILGEGGQTALRKILEPFCKGIDFCESTSLASRYWPLGHKHAVVVDPNHAFGKPTIAGTNTPTEVVTRLVSAGESVKSVGRMYDISEAAVRDALSFERRSAA